MLGTTRREWLALAGLAVLASACGRSGQHTPVPSGTPVARVPLTAIRMQGVLAGWGQSGAGIYRTADGGAGWSDASPPARPVAGGVVTAFADAQTAWVAEAATSGITLFSTTDGGAHWAGTAIAASSHLVPRFLQFLADRRHGWLWSAGAGTAQTEPGTLFATADGGGTWSAIASAGGGGRVPAGILKSGLCFRDATHGWISGTDPLQRGSPGLYASADGGATWAAQALPLPAPDRTLLVGTAAPVFFGSSGVLPVSVYRASIPTLLVFVSADGGATWAPALPVSSPYAALTPAFADALHWFASDGVGLFVSTSAGQQWDSFLSNPPKVLAGLVQMDFISPSAGWALCPAAPGGKPGAASATRLLRTVDGAKSWHAVG